MGEALGITEEYQGMSMKGQSQPEKDTSAKKRPLATIEVLRANVNQQGADASEQPSMDSKCARKQACDVMGEAMEPGRNWSSWYDFCGEEEVTSGRQEAQDKRKAGRGGQARGEGVKSVSQKEQGNTAAKTKI